MIRFNHHKDKLKKTPLNSDENKNYTLGLFIFFGIFMVLIPYILHKLKFYFILQMYFLNTDLLATVLSFPDGPFVNLFKYLYNDSRPLIGFISQTLISWSVLVGIVYVVLRDSNNKSILAGISQAIFIIAITFLIPNRFISQLMHYFYLKIKKNTNINLQTLQYLALIPGFLLAFLFISLEALCIYYFSKPVEKGLEKILTTI